MDTESEHTPSGRQEPSNSNRWVFLYISLLLITGLLAFYWLDPETHRFFWHCPFHALTGLWCPGCGGQRALHALLHARIAEALSLNALAVLIVAPVIVYGYTAYALRVLGVACLPEIKISTRWMIFTVVVFMIFGILRNIPISPFSCLAP
ncbi:MAG TPA: DUF2752 domain-containing protein [Candidatus Hydrogenedentes bacterium]|nr:DUF2752 domain-containing protein [Candidatus Hydrogenedentota bacterium]